MRTRTDRKRKSIVAAATPLFLEHGYAGLTMDTVMGVVGGSKATLYRYFPKKEDLFRAVVEAAGADLFDALERLEFDAADLVAALRKVGEAYVGLVVSPGVLAASRMVAAEAGRIPELGRMFFAEGPQKTLAQIAQFLAQLGKRHHLPDFASPEAAMHFVSLCDSGLHDIILWSGAPVADGAIADRVRAGVERFLAAYGHRPQDGQ